MPITKTDNQDRTELLAEVAYRRIKEDIVRCHLAPDSIVTESQLMSKYNLGRAPVRTALIQLSKERFAQPLRQRGYKISPITVKDVLELFDVGLILFPKAARMAAGCIGPVEERLRKLNKVFISRKASKEERISANREINEILIQCAGNSVLAQYTRQTLDQLDRIITMWRDVSGQNIEVRHDHSPLIDALASGDGDAAEQAARDLAEMNRRQIVDAILVSPHLAGAPLSPAAQIKPSPRRRRKSSRPVAGSSE